MAFQRPMFLAASDPFTVADGVTLAVAIYAALVGSIGAGLAGWKLYLDRRRQGRLLPARWEKRFSPRTEGAALGIRVYFFNPSTRPIHLQSVGIIFGPPENETRFPAVAPEGIDGIVTDGEDRLIWFIPASAAYEADYGPRTSVYVDASRQTYRVPFPPEPSDAEKERMGIPIT
jgi:hypothetical protein